jgi:hypothetical protein
MSGPCQHYADLYETHLRQRTVTHMIFVYTIEWMIGKQAVVMWIVFNSLGSRFSQRRLWRVIYSFNRYSDGLRAGWLGFDSRQGQNFNWKYYLVLTGMFRFKPVSQFVKRYDSAVDCIWKISFRKSFVNSISNKESSDLLYSILY